MSCSKYLLCCLFVGVIGIGTTNVFAVQAPNPRGAASVTQTLRDDNTDVSRATTARSGEKSVVSRSSARGAVLSNAIRGGATGVRGGARTATNQNRTARATTTGTARTAANTGTSRAATSRATAVFNDISKIGGGYAACRESYATCMDQFCANANDRYRRCYCSARFNDFRNTESALDEAKTLLMQFEDNNLNAVDKTVAEVNAMYSATIGEAAIKKDTSAAAKVLNEIGDLLSGKKKANSFRESSTSLGVLSVDLSGDFDEIWSDGTNSIFSVGDAQNFADLEGASLYNAANKQCMQLISESCPNTAVTNMARSSYSILVTQDCNAYQKNIDKQVESVKQAVRTAEKYLRDARLAEYRAHNSDDVNECITKVRDAMTDDVACGDKYRRCLDYTGAYINQTTGEAIYSPRLFQLTDLITLAGADGRTDILGQNPEFNNFLESRKIFATKALDGCRDIAATVWDEFKRTALIEIAQAQDEKIESVKMSCVSTMADCYDTQSSALKDFDTTTAQVSGAISASAARQMCADRVIACASLYGNTDGCKFDGNGKLTSGNSVRDGTDRCGLTSLLKFVDTVDDIRINEGCESALRNYATELCTPSTTMIPKLTSVKTSAYPWGCVTLANSKLVETLKNRANLYCGGVGIGRTNYEKIAQDLADSITLQLISGKRELCESVYHGFWMRGDALDYNNPKTLSAYYTALGQENPTIVRDDTEYCISAVQYQCNEYINGLDKDFEGQKFSASYQSATDSCNIEFSDEWYEARCVMIGGFMENGNCYVRKP